MTKPNETFKLLREIEQFNLGILNIQKWIKQLQKVILIMLKEIKESHE